jgi:hypothetical protein
MNPRDKRLRLRKSTVRGLNPSHAADAKGGTVRFDKKTATDDTNCFLTYNQVGCESYLCNESEGFTCPMLWTCDTCYQTCAGQVTLGNDHTCIQTECQAE